MASTALWPNPRETWISAEKCRHTYAGRTIDHFQDPYTRVDEKFVGISGVLPNPVFTIWYVIYGYTVYAITFGSGKQLFPGLTATGINSVRGALPVEIIDSLHFKL